MAMPMSIAVNAMMTYRIILISKLRQTHPVEGGEPTDYIYSDFNTLAH
jgi:hypothetical protein